jgi:hypothetical protein
MGSIARISSGTETALLSARTAGDADLLLDHLASTVRHTGRTLVEVDDRSWIVTLVAPDDVFPCSSCGRPLRGLRFHGVGEPFCAGCARTKILHLPDRTRLLFGSADPGGRPT